MSFTIDNDPDAHCSLSRQFSYDLTWLPERNYISGTYIEIRSRYLRSFICWKYTAMSMDEGDIVFRWKRYPSPTDFGRNCNRVILRAHFPNGARKNIPVKIKLTATPPIWAGIDNELSLWVRDKDTPLVAEEVESEFSREKNGSCTLKVSAGPVERISLYSQGVPGINNKVRTCIVPEDRFGNPGSFDREVSVSLEWENHTWTEKIKGAVILALAAPADVGRLKATVPMNALGLNENITNGVRQEKNIMVTGNPVWAAGPNGLKAGFGEFHWHTDISGDGQRLMTEALKAARDYLNMDYISSGDHNPEGENWVQTVKVLEEANEDDSFATFFGWEASSPQGHQNYYFTDPEHPAICNGAAGIVGGPPPATFVKQLREIKKDFIAIPHHTNSVAESRDIHTDIPLWHPYQWEEPEDYIRLVEIMQCRGNQERNVYDDAWRGWQQNYFSSVQDALALGHKVGFTGGTDNHCGWPGRAFAEHEMDNKNIHSVKSVILTGIWTERIERKAVFESLKKRSTWAVWDTRALVYYSVNDVPAGAELQIKKGEAINAYIKLSAEDALQCLEIVSETKVVWASAFTEIDIEITVPLGLAQESTHFYLRALQRDGGIIYASPVFVNVEI